MRIVFGIEYDGTCFQGFQRQPNIRTIQSTLDEAISKVANEKIRVYGAGRTDSHVHAINQVIHFDTNAIRDKKSWLIGTNSNLPKDISIKWAHFTDEQFDSRRSAIRRYYRYIISDKNVRSSILRNYITQWNYKLDEKKMHKASKYLIGTHDFSSFKGPECNSKTTIRRIDAIKIKRKNDFIIIDITANAFLHNMVRNIVGVLLKIGMGKRSHVWTKEVLKACDRTAGDITAPPEGLYLMNVQYPKAFQIPSYTNTKLFGFDSMF